MNVIVPELAEKKAKYDSLCEEERDCREQISELCLDLKRIHRERKAAYEAWRDVCRDLVG